MKKIILFFCAISAAFMLNPVSAQDTIYFRNNEIQVVKIIEVRHSEIRYKKQSNPDGPTFILSKGDLKKITYQDGTVELLADPKYRFKLYNPYIYGLIGILDGKRINVNAENPNLIGLGHDGLFKLLNRNNAKSTVGLFYSLNFNYSKVSIYDTNSYGYYWRFKYSTKSYEIANPYGIQLDFGREHVRFFMQGMFGPTLTIHTGEHHAEMFGAAGGLGFGLKLHRFKFGLTAITGNNDLIHRYKEITLRLGIEL